MTLGESATWKGGRQEEVGTILSREVGWGLAPSPVKASWLPTLPDQEGTAALRPASSLHERSAPGRAPGSRRALQSRVNLLRDTQSLIRQ